MENIQKNITEIILISEKRKLKRKEKSILKSLRKKYKKLKEEKEEEERKIYMKKKINLRQFYLRKKKMKMLMKKLKMLN